MISSGTCGGHHLDLGPPERGLALGAKVWHVRVGWVTWLLDARFELFRRSSTPFRLSAVPQWLTNCSAEPQITTNDIGVLNKADGTRFRRAVPRRGLVQQF